MMRTLLCVAAAATLLSACDRKTEVAAPERTAGPVVSTSEAPRNDAVDTTPTTGKTAQTPGANSFTAVTVTAMDCEELKDPSLAVTCRL